MTVTTELNHIVNYFKEIFNDTVSYSSDQHGDFLIKSEMEVSEAGYKSNVMFHYDIQTQTLNSLFNHTLKMISPHINLSKNSVSFVEYWKTHYVSTYNYPSRLYAALQKALGPTKKIIDTSLYSISIKLKTVDEQIIITHEVIFSMYNDSGGTDSFIITLDKDLELLDVIMYETGNFFIKNSKGLDLSAKKNLMIVLLGTLINKEFSKYVNKTNIDYSDRTVELLTILEY